MITAARRTNFRNEARVPLFRDHGSLFVVRAERLTRSWEWWRGATAAGHLGCPVSGLPAEGGRGPYGGDGVGAALGEVPRIAGVDELARRDGYASARGAIAMLIELYR